MSDKSWLFETKKISARDFGADEQPLTNHGLDDPVYKLCLP